MTPALKTEQRIDNGKYNIARISMSRLFVLFFAIFLLNRGWYKSAEVSVENHYL